MDQHQGDRRKKRPANADADPVIPDKLYFRIGEAARLLSVAPYVLRFWESEFPQLRPGKGGTGQRLYRRRDVEMALRIKRLLYQEGYTIPGARQLLKTEQRTASEEKGIPPEERTEAAAKPEGAQARLLRLRAELKEISRMLAGPAPNGSSGGNAALRVVPPGRRGLHVAARRESVARHTPALLFPLEQQTDDN